MTSVANVAFVAGESLPLKPSESDDVKAADEEIVVDTWPAPMGDAALRGLAGDIVRCIEPHSEADPVAILIQFLLGFGNIVGRSAYFVAEADRHHTNMFGVLVGSTAKGRKGTSWGQVRRVLRAADPEWEKDCISHGLSSGPGIIWAVRDKIEKQQPIRNDGKVDEYQMVVDDPGISDKRLMVVESEFATVLRVLNREGNTLSAVIRNAWDDGNLNTLTKNSPAKATGAHISIIGHITKDELLRYMSDTEAANGFGNRFLWICTRRSKLLPDGGSPREADITNLGRQVVDAIEFARNCGVLKRDEGARQLWHEVYADLSEGHPGLLGAITARAEPLVMRLALLYAVLDHSRVIRRGHLEAGMAGWMYAEQSARWTFGDALGDPVADEILTHLRGSSGGLTRTDIRNLFGRHKKANRMGVALKALLDGGHAHYLKEATGGRDTERWFAGCGGATEATKATEAPDTDSLPSQASDTNRPEQARRLTIPRSSGDAS